MRQSTSTCCYHKAEGMAEGAVPSSVLPVDGTWVSGFFFPWLFSLSDREGDIVRQLALDFTPYLTSVSDCLGSSAMRWLPQRRHKSLSLLAESPCVRPTTHLSLLLSCEPYVDIRTQIVAALLAPGAQGGGVCFEATWTIKELDCLRHPIEVN